MSTGQYNIFYLSSEGKKNIPMSYSKPYYTPKYPLYLLTVKKDIKAHFTIYCIFTTLLSLFFSSIICVLIKTKSDIGQLIKRAFQGSAVS